MEIQLSVPSGMQEFRSSGSVSLAGHGMMVDISVSEDGSMKPLFAYDDTESEQLRSDLREGGMSNSAAKKMLATVRDLRGTGCVSTESVEFDDIVGMKYQFLGSNPQHSVVHYSLRVPGGNVRVVATSPVGTLDVAIVESLLPSLRIGKL